MLEKRVNELETIIEKMVHALPLTKAEETTVKKIVKW